MKKKKVIFYGLMFFPLAVVAVIVVFPSDKPSTKPWADTLATFVLELFQVIALSALAVSGSAIATS